MRAPRRLAGLVAVLCALAIAACGDDEPDQATSTATAPVAERLSEADRELVAESEAAIVDYCRRRALALTDPDKRPTVAQQARALEGVDAIVTLAQDEPAATVRPGVDVALFLGDLTENLEGSNCDPQILARLDAGLAGLP